LEKQLVRLGQQAEIARRFEDLQSRLDKAQNLLWFARKQEAASQRALAEKEIQSLQTAYEAEAAALRRAEKQLEEKRTDHFTASDLLHDAQGELYASNAEVAHTEQQIQHVRENYQRIAQQIAAMKHQLEHYARQADGAVDSLNRWREEYEQARSGSEASKQKAAVENEKLPLVEAAFRARQEKLAEAQRDLLLAEQSEQLEKSHHTHAEKTLQQLEIRRKRLLVECDALPESKIDELSDLTREAEAIERDLKQKQEEFAHTENLLLDAEEVKREFARNVQALEQQVVQAEARLTALQRLQGRLESSEGLSAWLASHRLDSLPRFWQGVQIEKGWEDALEAVLRERLNSTRVAQLEVALEWASLPPGKCALFEPTETALQDATKVAETEEVIDKSVGERGARVALRSYLTCSDTRVKSVVDEWLSGIFVIDSLDAALSQRSLLSPGEILVTREGCVVTRHSLTFYSPDSQLHGVLARQREIAEIEVEMEALRAKFDVEQSALDTAGDRCYDLESSLSSLRYENEQLQQLHHNVQMQALKLTQIAERSEQRRQQIDGDLAEIEQHAEAEVSRQRDAEAKLTEHRVQIELLQEQMRTEQLAREIAEESLIAQRRLAQNASREMQEAVFHEKTCEHKIAEAQNAIGGIERSVGELKAHLEKLQVEQDSFDESQLVGMLQERLALREKREQKLAEARNALEALAAELRQIEQERMASEQKLHPLREAINHMRLKEQEARITENQFGEQLQGCEIPEEELLDSLGKTRPAALQGEVSRLRGDITALGSVNTAALDELQSCQARKTYLDSQAQDLEEASETLRNAIRRIDRETRERLLETVETVNNHLGDMFPTIFGGGHAKLVLRGEEILDAGIQIVAQPPGKKNSSIHLLSGGEKALTALAFVFSLFQLNPAPFCLLDEVDAPLDDSNTERFCNLVRKMSRQTQFVFISHNKITMEMAQQLIGVTMQEKGVSRVVAVEIEEAVRLGNMALAT
jgi:chromosome segregation protein